MSVPYKVISVGGSVVAGLAARKAVSVLWRVTTGRREPGTPEHPDSSWGEAVAFAVASGAALALARLFAARQAASYYRRSTGHLPPELEA